MEVMQYLFREKGHVDRWREALAQVKWQGRMEEILPSVYVDGAHNVSAIDAFVKSVPETAEGIHYGRTKQNIYIGSFRFIGQF